MNTLTGIHQRDLHKYSIMIRTDWSIDCITLKVENCSAVGYYVKQSTVLCTGKLSPKYEPGSCSRFLPSKREFPLAGVACSGDKFLVFCIFLICCTKFPWHLWSSLLPNSLRFFKCAHLRSHLPLWNLCLFAEDVYLPHYLLPCSVFPRHLSCEIKPPQLHFGRGARLFLVLQSPIKIFFIAVNRSLVIL